MKFYGQGRIDSVIDQFFKLKGIEKGTFLDVGSLDGKRFSNTYHLEKECGWTGICVEIHPSFFPLLKENRPNSICYSCAASDVDHSTQTAYLNWRGSLSSLDHGLEDYFKQHYGPWYGPRYEKEINGFLNGEHEVPTRTLNSILDENKEQFPKINFVTVDIDGSELKALPHLDLNKINPELLCLEWSTVGQSYINDYAAQFDMHPVRNIAADTLFCKKEDIELLSKIKEFGEETTLPNPCDQIQ